MIDARRFQPSRARAVAVAEASRGRGRANSGPTQVSACTPFVTCVIGTSSGATPGTERREHGARDAAVQPADAVHARGHADAERRHVEDARVAARLGAEREQAVEREAGGHAAGAEVARHQLVREAVDAGRHGRVRREERARAHDLQRVLRVAAALDEHAHALEREEARVPLVHVEHGGLDAAGGERLDAADAEQDLLPQPVLAVAAVEAVGDRALGGGVRGHVGVEQEQRDAADVDAPERGVQASLRGAAR